MGIVVLIAICVVAIILLSDGQAGKRVADRTNFEKAFKNRIGQDPETFVASKLSGGSKEDAVRYLFDITAAEIEVRYRCKSPGFDYYYVKTLGKQQPQMTENKTIQKIYTEEFIISELIGKERFLRGYEEELKRLAQNQDFILFIIKLQEEIADQGHTEKADINRQIANYFFFNRANERFPEVKSIVDRVLSYGKQASAHISIYYAIFLYIK